MKRLFQSKLVTWSMQENPKPLIVRGARQVGKTHVIQKIGETIFQNVVTLNFEKTPSLGEIFAGDFDVKTIISKLELIQNVRILPKKTLIFFDEIQKCPRALMALRYFKEEAPDYRVIAAGSLLDFALGEISFPVGRVSWLTMYPMTFLEFLWALGEDALANLIQDPPHKIDNLVHQKLLSLVKKYAMVGGMPAVVKNYCETQSLLACQNDHRDLIETYKQDFGKYATKARFTQMLKVIEQIPKYVSQQIKYVSLDRDSGNAAVKEALTLLERAQIIHRVNATSGRGLPLGAEANPKIFKEIFLDVGLMQTLCGIHWQDMTGSEDLISINSGALAEQFVGQELLALQINQNNELFYWKREEKNSNAEVDYVIAYKGEPIPIEVKSSASGHLKSLHLFCETYKPKNAFVISSRPFSKEGHITFVPFYFMTGLIYGDGLEAKVI